MKRQSTMVRVMGQAALVVVTLGSICAQAQSAYERTFPQSKATIEKALKTIQGSFAGRLPTLDGFAKPASNCSIDISAATISRRSKSSRIVPAGRSSASRPK